MTITPIYGIAIMVLVILELILSFYCSLIINIIICMLCIIYGALMSYEEALSKTWTNYLHINNKKQKVEV